MSPTSSGVSAAARSSSAISRSSSSRVIDSRTNSPRSSAASNAASRGSTSSRSPVERFSATAGLPFVVLGRLNDGHLACPENLVVEPGPAHLPGDHHEALSRLGTPPYLQHTQPIRVHLPHRPARPFALQDLHDLVRFDANELHEGKRTPVEGHATHRILTVFSMSRARLSHSPASKLLTGSLVAGPGRPGSGVRPRPPPLLFP